MGTGEGRCSRRPDAGGWREDAPAAHSNSFGGVPTQGLGERMRVFSTSVQRFQARQSLTRTRTSTGRSLAVASSAVTRGSSSSASSRRAASIPRHFGKNRSSAKRQPVAGNFHARTEATRPRLPFFQKLLPLLRQTLRFESGRIWPEAYHHPAKLPNTASGQNYLTRSVYKTQGKLVR